MTLYAISTVVGLYTTFVLMSLWDWFVSPTFHIGEISFWTMFGFNLLIGLFRAGDDSGEQIRFKVITTVLDACVPDEKKEDVKSELDEMEKQVWWDMGLKVFGQVFANSVTLGIGFVVHLLAA